MEGLWKDYGRKNDIKGVLLLGNSYGLMRKKIAGKETGF
jgi:hypothetical protein